MKEKAMKMLETYLERTFGEGRPLYFWTTTVIFVTIELLVIDLL